MSQQNLKYNYQDQVVIVTGAASGLGESIALGFAKAGARVIVADIQEDKGLQVVAALKKEGAPDAKFIYTDVTDEESVSGLIKNTLDAFGKLDIMVNNAGKGGPNMGLPFTRTEKIDWDTSYEINLRGTFYCCKAVYNLFIKQGHGKIINMSSITGRDPNPMIPHYSAAKAGIISLTQALAKELAPYNINVNAVCPGRIYTPIWDSLGEKIAQAFPQKFSGMSSREVFLAAVNANIPMKREQTEEDIANAVMFLASEEAKNITGQALSVCGGEVMR